MKALIPDTYDMALAAAACASLDELNRLVERYAAPHGVQQHLGGIVPSGRVLPKHQLGYVILGKWPEEWAARYFRSQYVRDDPTIEHAKARDEPLYWRDLRSSGRARRIMAEATEFGLSDGITLPQYTVDGVKIGISFAGDRIDTSPTARTSMLFLSSIATARALELNAVQSARKSVQLTRREREVLLWIASGKTDWEIGIILGIAERTVEVYVRHFRQKLGAATRSHAVAIAMRLGILN